MKILLSAYACDPSRGSEHGYGWNWAKYISQQNEVYCLTTIDGKAEIEKKSGCVPKNLIFIYIKAPKIVDKMYTFPLIGNYLHYFIWQKKALQTAKQLDKIIKFDYVHHVTYGSFQMGSSLWRLKIPMIFGPVGGGQHAPTAFRGYFGKAWINEMIRKFVSSFFLHFNPNCIKTVRQAKVVLVSNEETYRMAKKLKAKSVEIFFDPSLPVSFFPITKPYHNNFKPLKLLWVGRLMPRKGLKLALEAISKVGRNRNISLTVVGGGEMEKELPYTIENLGISDRVIWVGKVPFEEVKEYYKTHHLFLFTSLRDSCPAQNLEAMAFGLPVITLDLHGSKLFVPDNAGMKIKADIPCKTVSDIAKCIEYLYDNPSLITRMSQNAFDYAKQHTWETKTNYVMNEFYN